MVEFNVITLGNCCCMNKIYPLLPIHLLSYILFYVSTLITLISCQASTTDVYPSPKEFDLNHPYQMDMPKQLDEISGIEYYAKDTSIFAISDATGSLYKIFLKRNLAIQKWKFGKNADYEDLQLVDSVFYILSSSGDIARIKFYSADSLKVDFFKFPEKGNNEFESMYYDKDNASLNMICKDCEADKKKSVSIWSFNIKEDTYKLSVNTIDVSPIAKSLGLEKIRFKPSATAINPRTNELFILSSVNKALIIADKSGDVKEVYALDPKIYKQPEGIAFTPSGDLLISNESHKTGYANILVFKLKKSDNQIFKLKKIK